MDTPGDLLCLFSAEIQEQQDSYTIEIPKQEVTTGNLTMGEVYRTALFSVSNPADAKEHSSHSEAASVESNAGRQRDSSGPPVEEGEIREVDIEDIGDQGDGITRVERGFVVIVPETEKGERVTIEITEVKPNVAFGEVQERQTHF